MDVDRDQLMAASIGNKDWLQLCMKASDSQVKADRYGFTALHMAAIHSHLRCLALLLEDHGMDVNAPSTYGWRALHLVMNQKSGHRVLPCLQYLLQRGADVNVRSQSGSTPLHRAASEGLEDCITVLVDAGADVHAEDSEGNKPIDLCHLRCRRSSARYLRSAMWNKDKQDFAREMKKLEKIKQNIEESEEDAILQMQIPFCDCPKTKHLTEELNKISLKMETSPKSAPAPQQTSSRSSNKSQKIMKKGILQKENTKKVMSPKGRVKVSDEERVASKNSVWNVSTNPQTSPTACINRAPALWQGAYPGEVTKKDISSRVLLTKDEQGQLQIQTLQGQVFSPPSLPHEVIERSLFPQRGPQERIRVLKDFKATHVFDVPRQQQSNEAHKPESEISYHLRRDLDLKFRKPHRWPLSADLL
ncbi:ankyrin repeat domain-containing protein 53 isoform X2 [Ranitomeya variabilis]|uniref:ankyrin repeat domain-containing protein 53 isoform X2 n=1 Tax=Ranitomeya variabilis TaxID=490064 RepID=UPI004056FB55